MNQCIWLRFAAIFGVVALVARAETNKTDRFDPFPSPVTGMSITPFAEAVQEIKGQIPVGPKVISITIQDETHIIVTTGKITGPLAGGGAKFFFEKIDGKWKKLKEINWVS